MMKISSLLLSFGLAQEATGFVVVPTKNRMVTTRPPLTMTENELSYEPYFEIHQIPTAVATSARKLDRIVECAEHGESCDVTEMMEMMDELERLNMECSNESSRECSLDAVAARNVLKVALAANIAVGTAAEECSTEVIDAVADSDDPYADMALMHDECMDQKMHQIPTATNGQQDHTMQSKLDHIVECAENGQCDVQEMTEMIDELERLNMDCHDENTLSRECSLDAIEARNILKVALASKVNLDAQQRMRR